MIKSLFDIFALIIPALVFATGVGYIKEIGVRKPRDVLSDLRNLRGVRTD